MIAGRRAWIDAFAAYVLVGGLIAVSFYSRRLEAILNDAIVFAILAVLAAGSLIAVFRAWRQFRRGEPIRPITQAGLLPEKIKGWVVGESDDGNTP